MRASASRETPQPAMGLCPARAGDHSRPPEKLKGDALRRAKVRISENAALSPTEAPQIAQTSPAESLAACFGVISGPLPRSHLGALRSVRSCSIARRSKLLLDNDVSTLRHERISTCGLCLPLLCCWAPRRWSIIFGLMVTIPWPLGRMSLTLLATSRINSTHR